MNLEARCQAIEVLLSDVDGVLTDGGVVFDGQGIETKKFNIRDGLGIRLWQQAGKRFGLVTGRKSHIVERRAAELEVDIVRQGIKDKLPVVREVVEALSLRPAQVAYIGDDLPDLPVLNYVGFGVAVADACDELREAADFVTQLDGGRGAVRETIEIILKSQRRWTATVEKFRS